MMLSFVLAVAIHDCASFGTWFKKQPASQLTLESGDRKYPAPKSKGTLQTNFSGATTYKGNVGGGGCLGGWYDAAHSLVAIRAQYDTYQDILIFHPAPAPQGLPSKDLSSWGLSNGVRLGMTLNQVRAILGDGKVIATSTGDVIRYEWTMPIKDSNSPEVFDISLLFQAGILTGIDYGYGV